MPSFLDTAEQIGHRLARQAIWYDGWCTWDVAMPDFDDLSANRAVYEPAPGLLYQGTAGVALFLCELHALRPDPTLATCALGALHMGRLEAAKLPRFRFGLHTGAVGIAYAHARAGRLLHAPDLFADALAVLAPLLGHEQADEGLDVIDGAAGAIPALLQIAHLTGDDRPVHSAVALGDLLIEQAFHEPIGWSWRVDSNGTRNLVGYAHGASGPGHAFLELYDATGDQGLPACR